MAGVREYTRFCAWLSVKLRTRGVGTALSLALNKERNWAGRVAKGTTDIPFNAAFAITEYFKTSLGQVLQPDVPAGYESIALPSKLADAMRDPIIVAAVEALQRVDAEYRLQTAQGLRMVAKLPLVAQTAVPTDGIAPGGNTISALGRRPAAPGSKGRE